MRKSLLLVNQQIIIDRLKQKILVNRNQLYNFVKNLKSDNLISQVEKFTNVYHFLIELGLKKYILSINGKVIERYSIFDDIKPYQFAISIKPKSFFSMTTALFMQGYIKANNFIFVSHELLPKNIKHEEVTQISIDDAYRKPYRVTHNYGQFQNDNIIVLYPKNTQQSGVIPFNGYRMSSINRCLVEMIVNVQYFKTSLHIIEIFTPLKKSLYPDMILSIIEKFNFIYPYYQLVGYFLEQIGFTKNDLSAFKQKVSNFKFYTDKQQNSYEYDSYWQIYFIKK
jgi:hypothetical protein